MTPRHSAEDSGRDSFIRWSAAGQRSDRQADPGFIVDRRRLYRYLSSLESFSGE